MQVSQRGDRTPVMKRPQKNNSGRPVNEAINWSKLPIPMPKKLSCKKCFVNYLQPIV